MIIISGHFRYVVKPGLTSMLNCHIESRSPNLTTVITFVYNQSIFHVKNIHKFSVDIWALAVGRTRHCT